MNSTSLDVTIQNMDFRELTYRSPNGRNMIEVLNGIKFDYLFTTGEGYFAAVDLVTSLMVAQEGAVWPVSGLMDMPPNPYEGSFAEIIINLSSSTLFSLSLSLLLPVFMYAVVLEKEEKLIEMMKMNGCEMWVYWVSVFIFDFVLSLITFGVFMVAGRVMLGNAFFKETGTDIFVVVLLGWTIGQLGVAIFFQTFLATARTANIVGYLLSIWTSIISTTLNLGVFPYPKEMSTGLLLYPPLGFGRIIYMMLSQCSNVTCYKHLSDMPSSVIFAIVWLYLGGVILFVLGVYFYEILPKEIGVARPWYYPIEGFLNRERNALQMSEFEMLT